MKKPDKLIFGFVIGGVFPILLGLLSVLLWFYLDGDEKRPVFYLICGLLIGIIINLKYLKGWIKHRFNLHLWFLALIYIFYNIFLYGFFMGFPVFNVLLGLLVGYYIGNRIYYNKIQPAIRHDLIRRVSLFTAYVMTLICVSSAIIGLSDETIGENIRLMFKLDFEITKVMIVLIIIVGGPGLIALQYFITKFSAIRTLRFIEGKP